jgi:glycosyltransferase involved in cell wall biosynthesis
MRVAQVAPLSEAVPPPQYGGTERVVSWLTEELAGRGHEVTLFASGDSRTRGRLVAAHARALRLDPSEPDPVAAHVIELSQVFERAADFDLIHCHVDILAFPFGRLVRTPVLHTMHGRLDLPILARVFERFADVPVVSISDAQRAPLAALPVNWQATVHHGLPLGEVPFDPDGGRGGYLAFVGRISPEKRPDLAIAVARRLGLPLKIAAKVDPADARYFEHEIRPLLRDPLVEYLGEVGDADKRRLLTDALCLLFPIDWPEPFGITVIESMACGTPVVARPCGAVPEIVADGETGFLGDTIDDLVAGVKRVDLLDRARCRRRVEERFSVETMADRYEAVYRGLLRD